MNPINAPKKNTSQSIIRLLVAQIHSLLSGDELLFCHKRAIPSD